MPDHRDRTAERLVPWLVAIATLTIGLVVIRPITSVPVGFDTQATVLYFDRIAAGSRLEQALTTTPKPFLTLVYGSLHALTGDWRPIIWATMLAQAAAAAMAALLATRAVGRAAGIAAGLVVAGTPLLVEDTAFGNAVPWALLGWLIAALLLTGERPRPALAGAVLALAALCRLETLVVVAVVGVALAWARWGPWPPALAGDRPQVASRTWLAVGLPFAALPVMLVHDALLTGDPFFWVTVSQRYSDAVRESGSVLGPLERAGRLVRRLITLWPALPLALVGVALLVRDRRWGELVGLAGMGGGIAAFIVVIAARGLYAPDRYAIPVDVATLLLAAVGFGGLVDGMAGAMSRRVTNRRASARATIVVVAFVLAAGGVLAARGGPIDPELARVVGSLQTLSENTARAVPLLREAAAQAASGTAVRWLVPTAVRPRVAVELGAPLPAVAGLSPAVLDPAGSILAPGQGVFHSLEGDVPRGAYGALETGGEVRVGLVVLRPLLADEQAGLWVYETAAAP